VPPGVLLTEAQLEQPAGLAEGAGGGRLFRRQEAQLAPAGLAQLRLNLGIGEEAGRAAPPVVDVVLVNGPLDMVGRIADGAQPAIAEDVPILPAVTGLGVDQVMALDGPAQIPHHGASPEVTDR
jgi:hypothetical protein